MLHCCFLLNSEETQISKDPELVQQKAVQKTFEHSNFIFFFFFFQQKTFALMKILRKLNVFVIELCRY